MTFQDVSSLSQSWGLVFLATMFLVAIAYALWPTNKDKFDKAAKRALDKE